MLLLCLITASPLFVATMKIRSKLQQGLYRGRVTLLKAHEKTKVEDVSSCEWVHLDRQSDLCGVMQSSKVGVFHSLVHVNIRLLHQEPQRRLLASDSSLVQRLSSELIGGCWRRLQWRAEGSEMPSKSPKTAVCSGFTWCFSRRVLATDMCPLLMASMNGVTPQLSGLSGM